jgi:hypothetical protein
MIPRIASLVTAALGVATGAYALLGPTYTRCAFATIGQTGIGEPVVTLAPARCETMSLMQAQSVWPMPLLALMFWSLVPLVAVFGVWSGRSWLIALALIAEASSIISFGLAPYYIPFVAAPLAITLILASVRDGSRPHPPDPARPASVDAAVVDK